MHKYSAYEASMNILTYLELGDTLTKVFNITFHRLRQSSVNSEHL